MVFYNTRRPKILFFFVVRIKGLEEQHQRRIYSTNRSSFANTVYTSALQLKKGFADSKVAWFKEFEKFKHLETSIDFIKDHHTLEETGCKISRISWMQEIVASIYHNTNTWGV